jgi:hypothetical protein
MSWIFGISGVNNNLSEKSFTDKNLLFSFQSENLKIFAGGFKENVFFERINESSGWVVCGIGILRDNSNYRFMDSKNWRKFLLEEPTPGKLDGHFISVTWNNDGIKFFNDKLGIRELYILKSENFVAFSTRPDFFSLLNHKYEINFNELSGYWLLSFPLSTKCLFKKIIRLGQGGRGNTCKNEVSLNNTNLTFDFRNSSNAVKFAGELSAVTSFPLMYGKNISLGLSGGLDSRVLLEMLLNSNSKNWQTHSFGSENLPDVKIAEQISSDKNINHQKLYLPVPQKDKCLSLLRDSISQLGPIVPASEVLVYPYYSTLFKQERVIIDGGDGEIHRREFLNRILFLSGKTIINEDNKKLLSLLSINRSSIFNDDILILMQNEVRNQVRDLFLYMPPPNDIGLENWLDLLILKYKLPDLSGPSQSLLDGMCVAYMPYIQPHLLELSFRMSVQQKKNGQIFRNILNKSNNKLNSYKLVKNSFYYSYNTGSLNLRFKMLIKRRFGLLYKEKTPEEFLNMMKEYILDMISSDEFNTFEYYNHRKIKQMVNSYYAGDKTRESEINWWLTFDIWRSVFLSK